MRGSIVANLASIRKGSKAPKCDKFGGYTGKLAANSGVPKVPN
jgi:hypothetical protein